MSTKLGQNFLTDENVARQIVESADLSSADNVLEIGPGKGVLTKYLADSGAQVLAVEIDEKLTKLLDSRFRGNDKIEINNNDILKIDLPRLIEENNFQNYKVVANLPYYITSKIIRLFLETKYPPSVMILMVQKEVGERIVAIDAKSRSGAQRAPGTGRKESILSISVKFYADPEILFDVPRENFKPVPEVDSVVIRIKRKKKISSVDIHKFFQLVRAGFSAKRKMLVNNLFSSFHIPRNDLLEMLKKADLESTVRAEKLGVEDWVNLYCEFNRRIKHQQKN